MSVNALGEICHPSLSADDLNIVEHVRRFTEQYFQNPKFDSSHDFKHVMRVVRNAIRILDAENSKRVSVGELILLDARTVILAALLHDVDDKKYVDASSSGESSAKQELLRLGIPATHATKIQEIVEGVSYSAEIKAPGKVLSRINDIPELAVVQDADRLDAIGAIGIGRCFTFGATHGARSLGDSIQHFEDKLVKLEGMMKTETGIGLAVQRTRRIREFMQWWTDETSMSGPA